MEMSTSTVQNRCVMADPGMCIGCKTCMAACIAKHDVGGDVPSPRLNLATTRRVSAPIACHHCVDAPCAAVCPTGALYVDGDRVAVEADRCIGCRSCVMACPFGAVSLATKTVCTKIGNTVVETHEKPFVIKCDLCYDRANGPACVEACPTDGMLVYDESVMNKSSAEKRHEAADAMASYSSVPLVS